MTIEEFLADYAAIIVTIADSNPEKVNYIEQLVRNSWESGYRFRIQEEELNKGASF